MLTVGSESNKAAVLANLEDPIPMLLAFQRRAGDRLPAARALAFEAVARRKGRLLDEVHDWGQSLRESPDAAIRNRFNQREAMLECQASLTIALGYRDLKPAVVGTCALPGTELDGPLRAPAPRPARQLDRRFGQAGSAGGGRSETAHRHARSRPEPRDSRSSPPPSGRCASKISGRASSRTSCSSSSSPTGANPASLTGAMAHSCSAAPAIFAGSIWVRRGPIDRAVQDLIAAANDWSVSPGRQGNPRARKSAERDGARRPATLSEQAEPGDCRPWPSGKASAACASRPMACSIWFLSGRCPMRAAAS